VFLAVLLVDGALAGAIYALVALAFVIVYKASRMVNFALGEWVMLGSRIVASGVHGLGLGLAGALGVGCGAMVGFAVAFNAIVLRRLAGQPLISFIMVSLGLGILIRGVTGLVFAGIPGGVVVPLPRDVLSVGGVPVATEKLVAAAIAVACIIALTWFFRTSRTGLALRAIASDQQVAMSIGIDLQRHFAIAWSLVGVLSVVAGVLWTVVAGGGFGLVLLGLRVFPIVIVGGLDSIPGTVVGALGIGILESLAAGYLDPLVGGGFSQVAGYLVLLIVLFVRPHGLFGGPIPERI
jgi:branched-chain amino acid transport system permease protein